MRMRHEVYSGSLRLNGGGHVYTIRAAMNYASSLVALERVQEAKSLLRRSISVARRVLGDSNDLTLRTRALYADTLYRDDATLDDLRESVRTFEEIEPSARRVLGGAHPITMKIERYLQHARAALRAREATQPPA
jgi:hypothetical protein